MNTKKILINIGCAVVLSGLFFGLGRLLRFSNIDKTTQELENKLVLAQENANNLYGELEQRIKECEQFERDAEIIQQGISNCKNINDRMAKSIKGLEVSSNNISDLVRELRKRYEELERQNTLMASQLNNLLEEKNNE